MYHVYVLRSQKDSYLYIGMSSDPERRLVEHNSGSQKATRYRRPFKLIYKAACPDRIAARSLEKKLKSGSGREFLKDNFIPR